MSSVLEQSPPEAHSSPLETPYLLSADEFERKLAADTVPGIPACRVIELNDRLIHIHEQPIPSEARFGWSMAFRRGVSFPLILDPSEVGLIASSEFIP